MARSKRKTPTAVSAARTDEETKAREKFVDAGSELSFPASDPPSYMGGAAVAGPPPLAAGRAAAGAVGQDGQRSGRGEADQAHAAGRRGPEERREKGQVTQEDGRRRLSGRSAQRSRLNRHAGFVIR
jgi:hypothetical protein